MRWDSNGRGGRAQHCVCTLTPPSFECIASFETKAIPPRADVVILGARVLSAPPKFAWGINMPTTLYDIMEDVYHHATGSSTPAVDFWKHIWPPLQSASLMSWTNDRALQGHGKLPGPIQYESRLTKGQVNRGGDTTTPMFCLSSSRESPRIQEKGDVLRRGSSRGSVNVSTTTTPIPTRQQ